MSPSGRLSRWLPVVAWMALIFVLSAQSGLRVSEDASVDRPVRTLAHLATYALLAGLLLRALRSGSRPMAASAIGAWVVAVVYGVTDEIHQSFVPDRTGRPQDVFVDAIGAAIGIGIALVVFAAIDRRRSSTGGSPGVGQDASG